MVQSGKTRTEFLFGYAVLEGIECDLTMVVSWKFAFAGFLRREIAIPEDVSEGGRKTIVLLDKEAKVASHTKEPTQIFHCDRAGQGGDCMHLGVGGSDTMAIEDHADKFNLWYKSGGFGGFDRNVVVA